MIIKEKTIPKSKFKTYINSLFDLENIFGRYNRKDENQSIKDIGYLIDKKDFDNIKNKLLFPVFKSIINDDTQFNMKLNELYGNNEEITFIPCEQKFFSSSKDLIDSLNKNSKYAIINLLVWKMINNGKYSENEGKINFEIKDNKISLSFGTGINIHFKFNSNIISYNNLLIESRNKTKIVSKVQHHKSKSVDMPLKNEINLRKKVSNYIIKSNFINKNSKAKIEKSSLDLSQEIKEEIFIIIKIYLFNLDLQKYVDYSMSHAGYANYSKYTHKGKCYIVNKEWMSEFKKYYLYDELYNYLEKEEIKKKLDIHHFNKSCYNELEQNIIKIYDEINNNAEFFKKYFNKVPKKIDEKSLYIKEVNSGIKDKNNREIKYYDEFVLLNSELKTDIIVKKYKKTMYENDYVINQGKIILCLNYYPVYQILIGSLNGENNFMPLSFINFIGGAELEYSFSELKNFEYNIFIKQLNENNNKILDKTKSREIGELYYINENKKMNAKSNITEIKEEDSIKYLIELYYSFDLLNFQIKNENKTLQSLENYYLINKEWINYLNKCYNYEKISQIIDKSE